MYLLTKLWFLSHYYWTLFQTLIILKSVLQSLKTATKSLVHSWKIFLALPCNTCSTHCVCYSNDLISTTFQKKEHSLAVKIRTISVSYNIEIRKQRTLKNKIFYVQHSAQGAVSSAGSYLFWCLAKPEIHFYITTSRGGVYHIYYLIICFLTRLYYS